MTTDQLKDTMRHRVPIKYRDITYQCVTAITYRMTDHGPIVQVEMLDKNSNSVVLANPAEVERA